MRVAVIGPAFTHGLTYQENMWAEHLARLGHAARVFHAGADTTPLKRIHEPYGVFDVQQVATRVLPRSTYFSRALRPAVREFNPELIVIHGDKLFARPVVTDPQLSGASLIATFSENVGMHEYDWRKPGISLRQRLWAIGFRMGRAGPIRDTCRRATLLIGNTPQARGILLPLFPDPAERGRIGDKLIDVPLGFSPEQFAHRPEVRERVRSELGIAPGDVVVCASSHFDAAKAPFVLLIIDALRRAMKAEPALRGLIIGFSDAAANAAASRQIAASIDRGEFADRFMRHNFADKARLAELYNAADIAVFGRASISCQEALGTGLVGCFAADGAVNHLVRRPEQAVFFRPGDGADLARKLAEASALILAASGPAESRGAFRRRLADASRWLGYDRIIAQVLATLDSRRPKSG